MNNGTGTTVEAGLQLKPTKQGSRYVSWFAFSICLSAFVFSYNTVCLTVLAELLRLKNSLTKQQFVYQLSIATSCFNLGAFLSPILYKKYVGLFGQLKGLLIIDIIGIIAIIVQMIQLEFYVLVAARFTMGFMIGISSAIIPVYISSIAPPQQIGKLGAYNQLLQTFGVVIAYIGVAFIDDQNKYDQIRWRIYLGFPVLFLILRIICLQFFFNFQALQRYIQNNQTSKIKQFSMKVYGNDDQQTILKIVQIKGLKKISSKNTNTFRTRFIVGLVVIASNQFSGTNSILYYAKQLFNKVTNNNTNLTQWLLIILSFVQLIATFAATNVVDKIGRKTMILRGQVSVAICLFSIFVIYELIKDSFGSVFNSVAIIVLIFLHLLIMNLTLGTCCIIYCTQILEDVTWMIITLKGLALSIALSSQYMIQYIGIGFMFLIFFGLTFMSHLFLRTNMMETKNKTTQQIYASFAKQTIKNQINTQSLLSQTNQQSEQLQK